MTAAERVAEGAALLDERRPGWAAEIDLDRLELASECRCVLGQLHVAEDNLRSPFLVGVVALDLDDPSAYGFNLTLSQVPSSSPEGWAELDELWIAEIERRTAVAS